MQWIYCRKVILKGYSNLSKIKDENAIDKYLSRIIVNTAVDFIRKNSKVVVVENDYLKDKSVDDEKSEIGLVIDTLPEELKDVIILKYFHGYKIDEVAEVLGISISTVKNRMHKALKILRVEIKEESYE